MKIMMPPYILLLYRQHITLAWREHPIIPKLPPTLDSLQYAITTLKNPRMACAILARIKQDGQSLSNLSVDAAMGMKSYIMSSPEPLFRKWTQLVFLLKKLEGVGYTDEIYLDTISAAIDANDPFIYTSVLRHMSANNVEHSLRTLGTKFVYLYLHYSQEAAMQFFESTFDRNSINTLNLLLEVYTKNNESDLADALIESIVHSGGPAPNIQSFKLMLCYYRNKTDHKRISKLLDYASSIDMPSVFPLVLQSLNMLNRHEQVLEFIKSHTVDEHATVVQYEKISALAGLNQLDQLFDALIPITTRIPMHVALHVAKALNMRSAGDFKTFLSRLISRNLNEPMVTIPIFQAYYTLRDKPKLHYMIRHFGPSSRSIPLQIQAIIACFQVGNSHTGIARMQRMFNGNGYKVNPSHVCYRVLFTLCQLNDPIAALRVHDMMQRFKIELEECDKLSLKSHFEDYNQVIVLSTALQMF